MGAFFTNCQVRSDDANAVVTALAPRLQSRAYVSPASGGWVTVYDEVTEAQDDKSLMQLARELSKALNTSVFGFQVHDSDIAVYYFCQNGVLVDEFDSCPNYFGDRVSDKDRQKVRGVTDKLLPLCIAGTSPEQIDAVIHPESEEDFPVMAEEIIGNLGMLLGLDENRISLGFEYFETEGESILDDAEEFILVGKGKVAVAAKPAEQKASKPKAATKGATKTAAQLDITLFGLVPAVGLLTNRWTDQFAKMVVACGRMAPGESIQGIEKKLHATFDREARDFLKLHPHPNGPMIEELKTARDAGPDALATLLAQRAPKALGGIAAVAIGENLEVFVSALLRHGLDPHATDHHGQDIMGIAGKAGADSPIYRMLKEAADKLRKNRANGSPPA